MLPPEVIRTDHNLEQVAGKASEQLARHRWHWTLDESNPQRVSIREYARQVGRSYPVIHQYAYAAAGDRASPINERLHRANMSAETQAATEAVAKARGQAFATAHQHRTSEVRRVREIARQRAEERGTSVEAEAPKVAETIVRHERAEHAAEAARRERSDIRFIEMEGYLVKAKRELLRALKLAPAVPWDDESRQLLSETVGNVRALLALIDSALSGTSGVDWDAELAKVAGDEDA